MAALSRLTIFLFVSVVFSGTTYAQVITEQDPNQFDITEIQGHYKSYYEDRVRIYHRDTYGEPVCCASHLLILIENDGDTDGTSPWKCFQVSKSDSLGFNWILMDKISSKYEPEQGLRLEVPVELYGQDGEGEPPQANIVLRVNFKKRNAVIESVGGMLREADGLNASIGKE